MRLRRRVGTIGRTQQQAREANRPLQRGPGGTVAIGGQVTGGQASPGGVPMTMPLAAVTVYPSPADSGAQCVTVGYQDLVPIYAADGAPIAASAPGRWDQLAAAGNPHPQYQRRVRAPIAGSRVSQPGVGRGSW